YRTAWGSGWRSDGCSHPGDGGPRASRTLPPATCARYAGAVRPDAAPIKLRGASLFLLALVVLAYANGLRNGFTQDDDYFLLANAQIRQAPWRLFYEPHPDSRVYRPLTFSSFALNYAIGGPRPFDYHLVNLLLHGLVTVLLYGLLHDLLGRPR